MKKKLWIGLVCVLLLLGLVGCGGNIHTDFSALTQEERLRVQNPSEQYIIACLDAVPEITSVEVATPQNDPSGGLLVPNGPVSTIYFSNSNVNSGAEDPIAQGTDAGGSIEVYANEELATARDRYLSQRDQTFKNRSHAALGSIVVRASSLLTNAQQSALTQQIVTALTQNDLYEKTAINNDEVVSLLQKERLCGAPFSAQDCIGMPLADLWEALENAGFSDIRATSKNIEEVEGAPENGSVISISIDHNTSFEHSDSFENTAIVRVIYVKLVEPKPTPTPVPTPTPTSVPEPTPVPTEQQPVEAMVWIPQNGKRYHTNPNCSNMKNPSQVTISQAQAWGYTPCQKCH